MSVLKILGISVLILLTVWLISLSWADANKNMIIDKVNDNILVGTSIEDVQDYLNGEYITYYISSRENIIELQEGTYVYKSRLIFGIDAPSSIIDLMSRRLVVSIWFDDNSQVALVEFDEVYTFL